MASRPSRWRNFAKSFYLPFPDFYKEYLPESALPELDHHYHTTFKGLQTGIAPLPHSLDFLEYLRERGLPTFLLSSIHHEHFEAQGGRLGWKHYFKQAYVQALDKRKVILHLLAEHELNADETIFIGDMTHDIETARHAGVLSCAVLTGYDSLQKLKGANPDLAFSATCAKCAIFSNDIAAWHRIRPCRPSVRWCSAPRATRC